MSGTPKVFAVLAFALASTQAHALPLANARAAAMPKVPPTLEQLAHFGTDFTAIVALDDCSGSIVRFKSAKPDDKALVLTNGHCYEGGFLNPGQVLTNVASTRSFELLAADGQSSLGTLRATKVLYATMTDTDVTLYQTGKTYAEIEAAYHVPALTISDLHPGASDAIKIVSGYWKKIYSCNVSGFVFELKEGNWTFKDSIRYSDTGCEVIGGTSGSPILHADTLEVVGINNTGNEDGQRCTENNPCEVAEDGTVTVHQGTNYGEELYQFYACLTADNQIDLSLAGCKLPKPAH